MKRVLFYLAPVFLACIVFAGVVFFISKKNIVKGALQVTSVPSSSVYLNGKYIGKTRICKCDQQNRILVGEYTIKLVPDGGNFAPYEDKVKINPFVLSVVDRTFGDVGKSSGSIITLSPLSSVKTSQLFVTTVPVGVNVSVDGNPSGVTPVLLQNMTDSDHEVTFDKLGFASKTIRIHTDLGYKLNITAYLKADLFADQSASPSSDIVIPTPTPTPNGPQALILETPTGFLRVRAEPALSGSESARVNPGQVFPIIGEQDGWYQIQLQDNSIGWVSASYVKKQ